MFAKMCRGYCTFYISVNILKGWIECAFVGFLCFIGQSGIWKASQGVSEGGAATSETAVGHILQTAARPESQPWSTTDVQGDWGGGGWKGILILSYQDRNAIFYIRTQNINHWSNPHLLRQELFFFPRTHFKQMQPSLMMNWELWCCIQKC